MITSKVQVDEQKSEQFHSFIDDSLIYYTNVQNMVLKHGGAWKTWREKFGDFADRVRARLRESEKAREREREREISEAFLVRMKHTEKQKKYKNRKKLTIFFWKKGYERFFK